MTRAFTLIEMLVVVAIVAMVSLALTSVILEMYRSNAYVFESAISVDNARRGLSSSLESLREATYGQDGSYPLASVATSSITFFAEEDGDSAVERVRVYLLDGTLYRGVTDAAGHPPSYTGQTESIRTMIGYVRNDGATPLFSFYDSDGVLLTAPYDVSEVMFVTMDIRVDLNPTRAPNVYAVQGSAALRNLFID